MKLEKRKSINNDDYIGELTQMLDEITGLTEDDEGDTMYRHYIFADDFCKKERCLAVRIPGRTVGGIWIDENDIITKIDIEQDCFFIVYPENINDLMSKYIGAKIEY